MSDTMTNQGQEVPKSDNGGGNSPHQAPDFKDAAEIHQVYTDGGHRANDDLIVSGSSHRKIANPVPSGMMAFSSTLLLLSLYTLKVADVQLANGVLTLGLFFGGISLFLSGLWEFASGNTLGATMFTSYAAFWWGFCIINIPWFGLTGTYDGSPGMYASTGLGAAEATSAIGLFYWIWFGITSCFLLSAFRSSAVLMLFLFCLDLTFAMFGAHQYTQNSSVERAAGALGTVTSFVGYYLASASFFTKNTSYMSLPVVRLHKQN